VNSRTRSAFARPYVAKARCATSNVATRALAHCLRNLRECTSACRSRFPMKALRARVPHTPYRHSRKCQPPLTIPLRAMCARLPGGRAHAIALLRIPSERVVRHSTRMGKANATHRERQPATHRKAAFDRIGKATRRAMPGSFPSTSQPRAASTRNSPSCEFLAGLIARFSPACLPCHGSFLGTGRLRAASTRDLHSSRIFPVVNGG
jgi:hypothetical protein